jgi:hypothetical protein
MSGKISDGLSIRKGKRGARYRIALQVMVL